MSATYLRDPGSLAAAAVSGSGRDLGPTLSAVHQNLHPSLHPGVHPASLPSRAAPSAGPSSITHTSASGGLVEARPMAKRPRMDMGGPIHHQGGPHVQPPPHAQSAAHGSHHQSSSALTPLRIDTRETVKVKVIIQQIRLNVFYNIIGFLLVGRYPYSSSDFAYFRTLVIIPKSKQFLLPDLKLAESVMN